jgi:restriction system protein
MDQILKQTAMTAEGVDEAIIVTSGKFTREAKLFAEGKPIQLMDGPQLLTLVQSVQRRSSSSPPQTEIKSDGTPAPICPKCGKAMVLRTARRGTYVGRQFLGCPSYPACNATRQI